MLFHLRFLLFNFCVILVSNFLVSCNPLTPGAAPKSKTTENYNPFNSNSNTTITTNTQLGDFNFTSVTSGSSLVSTNWSTSTNADSYDLSWGTASGVYTIGTLTGLTVTSTTISGLTGGTTYYFFVVAKNATSTKAISSETSTVAQALPAAPTSLSATAYNGTVDLSWQDTTSASTITYSILRGTASGGPYTTISTGSSGFTYQDSGRTNNTFYYYVVRSTNGSGSTDSSELTVKPIGSFSLSTPLTASSTQISMLWPAATGASNYTIKYRIGAGTYSTYTNTTATSINITGLTNYTTYNFSVTATNAFSGQIDSSNNPSSTPYVPIQAFSFTSATPSSAQIDLVWGAATGASTYNVSWGTSSGTYATGSMTGLTGTSTTITGLTNGTPYYFSVTATNAVDSRVISSEIQTTPYALPTAPSSLTATAYNSQVDLSWVASTSATTVTYSVLRSTTSGSGYSTATSAITATTYSDTGRTNGTTYYYVIRATNIIGSTDSSELTAKPISNFSISTPITASSGYAQVTWDAATGASSYQLNYRTGAGSYTTWTTTTATTATITGLTDFTTYNFSVTATNSSYGQITSSNNPSATPAGPVGSFSIYKLHTCNGVIEVFWTSASSATTYALNYGLVSNAYTATVTTTGTSYLLSSLTTGSRYYFNVTGSNANFSTNTATQVSATASCVLDKIATAPAAAYGLRQLRQSYAGPLVKVRRSSDNALQDIYADSYGRFDTNTYTTFVSSDSAYVQTWYDQSGNAQDVSTSTTGWQPRLSSAGTIDVIANSMPSPYFSGSQYLLNLNSSNYFTQPAINSAVLFTGKATTPSLQQLWSITPSTSTSTNPNISAAIQVQSATTGTTVWRPRVGASAPTLSTTNGAINSVQQSFTINNTTTATYYGTAAYTNGVFAGNNAAVLGSTSGYTLYVGGSNYTGAYGNYTGYMRELVFWFSNVYNTAASRQSIEGDQLWSIGTATTLQSSHPYYYVAP